MGWIVILLLGLAVLALLWRFVREPAALQLVAAAVLLALAGYAWQGRPELAGSPKRAVANEPIADSAFAEMRQDMLGRFGAAETWLVIAEQRARRGDTGGAAAAIRAGLNRYPQNLTLWLGYGNALVMHAGGLMTPAAQLAFDRAAVIAPDHPAPRFFYALSLAQSGRLDDAERLWRALLPEVPGDSLWREEIERQIMLVERARAMSALEGQAPGP